MARGINKNTAKKLIKMTGEVRGIALKSHGEFILKEKGRQGLEKLEKEMAGLGCPIKHDELRSMAFYPIGLEAVTLLAIKKIFNFDDEKFEEIGVFGSKYSLIMKVFMKYIASIEMMAKQAPKIWSKYYTIGNLKVVELDTEKRRIILRIENFYVHPLHCLHLKGYCANVVKMAVKSSVTCEETKCVHRGDQYHEFLIKW